MFRLKTTAIFLSFILALPLAGTALAQCTITGVSEAEWVGDDLSAPAAWKYTLTIVWDTDSPYGVSHINLVPGAGGRCTCEELESAFFWIDPAGYSDGEPGPCTVDYMMMIECGGDPSLDIEEPLFKFEYYEDTGCEPGNSGVMTAVFYSTFAPADIEVPNLALVDKHAQLSCWGELTGVFPGLPCDPLPEQTTSWGIIKSLYGQ